ncbi:helix-turn-helix transcriptional regulator [Flavivirga abyssicola]|uniref:helix-turn-helix domain-containing protein n=1 Tax=Flavivirga abyssicola TaxID=3063533 RepID=UPI0026DF0867|nr:helix-turn-helix transcriptional regulator [Flavivirga sp. MEBiC07777]WVK14823.1 helix-turn-helix transcriptional regulator [Flavivirga sp. MEBiC07777]
MRKYGEIELHLLNIQIGCVLRLARLKKGLSQHNLSLMLGSNPTMVGRVERFENISGWDKIYFISQQLDVDFSSLFILKSKDDLLSIVEESLKLESKLTQDKRDYYTFLKTTISNKYDLLKKKS